VQNTDRYINLNNISVKIWPLNRSPVFWIKIMATIQKIVTMLV